MKLIERIFQSSWNIFLTPFLIFISTATLILFAFLYQEDKIYNLQFQQQAKITTLLSEKILNQYAEKHISQLVFLEKILAIKLNESPKLIQTLFEGFLKAQPDVDQVRLLNTDGQEIIRLENHIKTIEPTPKALLQSKQSKEYFLVPKNASERSIFISPIDLNEEYGRVELPIKPVIRFASAVYDLNHRLQGVIVINVKADRILNRIENLNQSYQDQKIFLAGKHNDWLIAPPRQIVWSSYMGLTNSNAETYNQSLSQLLTENLDAPRRLETKSHTFYVKKLRYELPHYIQYSVSPLSNLRLIVQSPNFHNWLVSLHAIEKNRNLILITYLSALLFSIIISLMLLKRRKLLTQSHLQETVSHRFLETIPQAVILFDQQGKIFFQNNSMSHLLETSDPQQLSDLRTQENRANLWQTTSVKEDSTNVCEIREKDGDRIHYFHRQSFFVQDAERTRLFGIVFNDFTQIEQGRQKLQESATQIRTILDAAPDAILVSDAEGHILMSNQKAQNLFDLTYDEFLKLTVDDLVPTPQRTNHKDLREQFFKSPRNRIMTDRPNIYAQTPKGKTFAVEISLSPIMQQGQQNVISIIRDVTERQKMEQQLRQTQKMEALGQLTGGIAHDFNNLLTSIIGNLDLSIELLKEDHFNREDLEERLTLSVNGSLKAAKLTKRLLAFSRTESRADNLIDIGKQLEDEINIIDSACGKRIRIEMALKKNLAKVRLDPEDFTNAIINLATNARDAMPDGGIIFIKAENYEIDHENLEVYGSHIPKGQYVALTFSDKGVGIKPEQLEKIFEPFYTTKAKFEGTGLGLTMVFAFVRQSGGFIKVYSEVGIGTTFKMFFPVADIPAHSEPLLTEKHSFSTDASLPSKTNSAPSPTKIERAEDRATLDTIESANNALLSTETHSAPYPSANPIRVLIVDDEMELLNIASQYLESAGYKVFNASNADEAMTVLEVKPVDLVLTDLVMPGKNGFELEKDIHDKFGPLPVIFCSGFPEEALKKETKFRKNLILIDKPYRKKDLINNIEKALRLANKGAAQ